MTLEQIGNMKLKKFFKNLPVHLDTQGRYVVTLNGVETVVEV